MNIRDRIKEFRRVPPDQIVPNPKNWRRHSDRQANALRGLMAEIGVANAVIAREMEDGRLEIIDGHLRVETLGAAERIPVLVLDVSEAEADKLLLTLDPLAALAETDSAAVRELLASVETANAEVRAMIDGLVKAAPTPPAEFAAADPVAPAEFQCPKCSYEWNGQPRPGADGP